MVVVLNCGLVLRITAHLLFLVPSLPFSCAKARLNISIQQATDLPEPTGPRSPRKKSSDFIKFFRTSPSGL